MFWRAPLLAGYWPVICLWLIAVGVSTLPWHLTYVNQSILDSEGRIISTWADIVNRANLGMEVMHERNAHNFPLDLASTDDEFFLLVADQFFSLLEGGPEVGEPLEFL